MFMDKYKEIVAERAKEGLVPPPLTAEQVSELVEQLKNPEPEEEKKLAELLAQRYVQCLGYLCWTITCIPSRYRVPAGVDEAAYVKASFLAAVAKGDTKCEQISRERATELLGTMQVSRPNLA